MARAFQLRGRGGPEIEHMILHTGEHCDPGMSDVFFSELELPRAQFNLGVGSGPPGGQTGAMLAQIEEVLLEVNPDLLIVYGDNNSTVAGALAGTKLHIPVAHVEAGLRSFNRRMPEEINRVATDHICDLLLAPTPAAMKNLAGEALAARSVFTGDIMHDAVLFYRQLALERSQVRQRLGLESGGYAVVTMQRTENTDDLTRLRSLLDVFNEIAASGLSLVFPVQPRLTQRIRTQLADWKPHPRLQLVAPIGYLDMLWLTDHASMALTDSGGLQKEAFFLGCPCVTLRGETEWVETVEAGGNVVVGADPAAIRAAVERWQRYRRREDGDFSQIVGKFFGNGDAADRIVNVLYQFMERRTAERSGPLRTHSTQGDALAGRVLPTENW
jgi:UDP-GlcNAc3NAcA epimerase